MIRLTPKILMSFAGIELTLLFVLILLKSTGIIENDRVISELVFISFGVAASIFAFKHYMSIASEYRNFRSSRLVWYALGVNSLLLAIRIFVSADLLQVYFPNYFLSGLRGFLNHALSVPSSIFFLLGLLGMLHSFNCAGMATKLKRIDYIWIFISLVNLSGMLILRKYLEEGASPLIINRILQPIDLSLLVISSIVCIVLQRYASGFNGGRLAESLKWLVAYGLLPIVLVLVIQVGIPMLHKSFAINLWPASRMLWALLPWMTTMAAAVRVDLTYRSIAQAAEIKSIYRETQSALNLK